MHHFSQQFLQVWHGNAKASSERVSTSLIPYRLSKRLSKEHGMSTVIGEAQKRCLVGMTNIMGKLHCLLLNVITCLCLL